MTSASNPLGYLGSMFTAGTPIELIIRKFDPTPNDRDYQRGQQWLNSSTYNSFTFQGIDANGAVWEAVDNPKGNFSATANPSVNDDFSQGYTVGSPWVNTSLDTYWVCVDPITGGAVWQNLSAGGGGSGIPTIGSSTDNALVRWDGAAGAMVQNSNAILTDGGSLSLAVPLSVPSGGTGVATHTINQLLVGAGASAISSITAGTNDQILFGNTGSVPSFGSLIAGSGISIVGKTISATGGTGDVVGPASAVDERIARYDGATGKLIQNSLVGISDTGDITGVASLTVGGSLTLTGAALTVANGGSGATSLANNQVLLGQGTSAITGAGAQADGQLLVGRTGNSPTPAFLTAGTNISITNGAGSITINSTASGGLTYVAVAGTSQSMAVNSCYQNNNVALTTLTLPASAAAGDQIEVCGYGSGGFTIAQGAGQQIIFGDQQTTIGAGGSLSSANRYDNVLMRCVVANTTWKVEAAQGNITFV